MRYALTAALALFASCFMSERVDAQYVYVTGYAPSYVAPAPTVVYRPVQPVVYHSPVVQVAAPAPVVYHSPVVAAPVVTTRWRPILGGTVTRVRYGYAPAPVYYPY